MASSSKKKRKLSAAADSDEVEDSHRSVSRSPKSDARRSEADIRNEHVGKGALLLEFKLPASVSAEAARAWRKIEKFGFKLDRMKGCLIPHQLCHFGQGRRGLDVASHCAPLIFRRLSIDHSLDKAKTDLGWDRAQQYSHLCHLQICCNPFHIEVEEAWQNRKRNYCFGPQQAGGGGGKGSGEGKCECGAQPPCIRPYRPPEYSPELKYVKYEDADKAEQVAKALPGLNVKILAKDHYKVEDQKRENRLARKKKSRRHEAQATANKEKGSASAAAAAAADDDDDFESDSAMKDD